MLKDQHTRTIRIHDKRIIRKHRDAIENRVLAPLHEPRIDREIDPLCLTGGSVGNLKLEVSIALAVVLGCRTDRVESTGGAIRPLNGGPVGTIVLHQGIGRGRLWLRTRHARRNSSRFEISHPHSLGVRSVTRHPSKEHFLPALCEFRIEIVVAGIIRELPNHISIRAILVEMDVTGPRHLKLSQRDDHHAIVHASAGAARQRQSVHHDHKTQRPHNSF